MPKKVFWPAAMVVMGLIILAAQLRMLPTEFYNLWPLILIIVGLGGLLTSDRDEWLVDPSKLSRKAKPKAAKKTAKRKVSRKK
jgi:hypothetical protein